MRRTVVGVAMLAVLSAVLVAVGGGAGASGQDDEPSLLAAAEQRGDLTDFVAATEVAGIADSLADCATGPFTVFAPTDAAFAAIPPADLDALLDDPTALSDVLRAHIVTASLSAEQLAAFDGLPLETALPGAPMDVAADGDVTTVSGAPIIGDPVPACNGLLYVIDAVLVPGAEPVQPTEDEPTPEPTGRPDDAASGGPDTGAAAGGEDAGDGAAETLARTGTETPILFFMGAGLVVAGTSLVLAGSSRRRRLPTPTG